MQVDQCSQISYSKWHPGPLFWGCGFQNLLGKTWGIFVIPLFLGKSVFPNFNHFTNKCFRPEFENGILIVTDCLVWFTELVFKCLTLTFMVVGLNPVCGSLWEGTVRPVLIQPLIFWKRLKTTILTGICNQDVLFQNVIWPKHSCLQFCVSDLECWEGLMLENTCPSWCCCPLV